MTIDTARCNGKRVLSYIDLNYPFAAATHRPCPGCPDCAPQKSEPDCTEPAPSAPQGEMAELIAWADKYATPTGSFGDAYPFLEKMSNISAALRSVAATNSTLAQCRELLKFNVECVGSLKDELLSARSRIAELESRQPQSAEWVPWKEGDPLPPAGRYLVSRIQGREHVTEVATSTPEVVKGELRWWPLKFSNGRVIAYIPQRLPDPYTDAQGKRDE